MSDGSRLLVVGGWRLALEANPVKFAVDLTEAQLAGLCGCCGRHDRLAHRGDLAAVQLSLAWFSVLPSEDADPIPVFQVP